MVYLRLSLKLMVNFKLGKIYDKNSIRYFIKTKVFYFLIVNLQWKLLALTSDFLIIVLFTLIFMCLYYIYFFKLN